MIRFRERNPITLGLAGLAAIALLLGLGLNTASLIGIGGTGHSALFGEAGGIKDGDPVKVGGFEIGRVTEVALDGPDVRVDFRVSDSDVQLGDSTGAAISVDTILGEKYLKLSPAGPGELSTSDPIPRDRTTAPYDLPDALSTVTDKAAAIDTPRLAEALDTVSSTVDGKAPELRAALDGVGRLSRTISSRDQELRELLGNANGATAILAERSQQVKLLIGDGNLLMGELQEHRKAIEELLVNASAMSRQLNGLVADNQGQIGPALDRLNSVLAVLKQNEDNVSKILTGAGIYATGLGEAVSSGPFFSAYVQNLIPGNLIPLSDFLPDLAPPNAEGGN